METTDTAAADVLDVIAAEVRLCAVVGSGAVYDLIHQVRRSDVRKDGVWSYTTTVWRRYDRPWTDGDRPGESRMIGSVSVVHGVPTRYDLLLHHATVTPDAVAAGWTPELLCDDLLALAATTLADCPRVLLPHTPVKPFPRHGRLGA